MKLFISTLLLTISFAFMGCDENFPDLGSSIQPSGDQISISTDTFHLSTESYFVDSVLSTRNPSKLLLGRFYDEVYGSTSADIFAQFNCPVGYLFPPDAIPDSVILRLNFTSVSGDTLSPMSVSVYEMNKATFNYSGSYSSTLNPSNYADPLVKLGSKIFKARIKTSNATDVLRFKLDGDNFTNRFFDDASYSSITNFLSFFKGLYIKAEFGSSTILSVKNMDVLYYYHYLSSPTGDTISHYKVFAASNDVRQVNRVIHSDTVLIRQKWTADESLNYVAAPSNIYTLIRIPLLKIKENMITKLGADKQLMINTATLKVEAENITTGSEILTVPILTKMLLIKRSGLATFFSQRLMPSDTLALYGELTKETTVSGTNYFYSFNLGGLIAREIQNYGTNTPSNLDMVLVPVNTTVDDNNNPTGVYAESELAAITIRSGKHPVSPMRLKMVYSGF